jgi:hypothetical protein
MDNFRIHRHIPNLPNLQSSNMDRKFNVVTLTQAAVDRKIAWAAIPIFLVILSVGGEMHVFSFTCQFQVYYT